MRKEFHIISTGKQSKEVLVEKVLAIQTYIDYIHLREKNWRAIDYVEVIEKLIENGFPKEKIIVNDRIDVAQVTNVYGVQLAYHSLHISDVRTHFPNLHINASVHSIQEAKEKELFGADRVIFGHIFPTQSKQGVPPKGLELLEQVVKAVDIPVVAIGGIDADNIHRILHTGAAGIAVLSGVLLAENPVVAAKLYREKLDHWGGG